MKALSLYIDKWYIVGAVVDNNGSHPLSLPNAEERVWLYFYNDMEANCIRYSESYKGEALANAMNYYSDIFSLIPRCKEKNYKWYGSDKPMKTIFEDAGIFADLRGGFDEKEKMPTYIVFSSDICLESQSIFMDLLRENGFEIKQFVAHIEDLAVEYAYKRGKMAGHKYVLVANACNENLHYALYHQQEGQFIQVGNGKTLYGKGEDARKYAIVEQVIDIINAGSRLLSDDEERQKEHQYLSQFADRWLSLIDDNDAKATPLGNICFSKQKNNRYPVSVLKSDIDKRTDAAVDEIVSEMVKIVEGSDIQNHEVSHVLLIGDSFDNGQFMLNLQKRFAISDDKFIHIHERELAAVVGIYRELPANSFNAEEKKFKQELNAEITQAKKAKKNKDALEEATQKAKTKREESQKAAQLSHNIESLQKLAEESERKDAYEEALHFFKEALDLSPDNVYFKEKIEKLTDIIAENKSKKKQYDGYIAKAKQSIHEKKWDEAITFSSLALGVMPNSKEANDISKRANETKNRYTQLEKYITKINTLVDHGNFEGALDELDKVRELKLSDSRTNDLRKKILKSQKIAKVAELKGKIDDAVWKEDWQTVVSVCQETLNLQHDEEISNKLKLAKEKLERIAERQEEIRCFEKANELVENRKFEEAEKWISRIAEKYPDKEEKIKKLRKRLFDAEDEYERLYNHREVDMPKMPNDDDDFFGMRQRSSAKSHTTTKPHIERTTGDDFFDS